MITILPLGAGQDVGRSCIVVNIGGKSIMFDCGMHMGYQDERRFPDFTHLSKTGAYDDVLDCIIISHFHLDHCGSLPYFTEKCGYNGPIYMTYPTKAICPILLEDMRKVMVERKGDNNFFSTKDIKNCMKKVIPVDLRQVIQISPDFEIKAYYAGHVIGAAMFHVRVGSESVVYTGDYNMTPDRHLGAAWIDKCRPDVLITESTYATTIRDSKRARERDFLKKVHDCVLDGGKVLIPVFALGRAQELCILLESYWERMALDVPVFFSAGMTERANEYYKLFINWTNQKIKDTFVDRNMFDFNHIKPFQSSFAGNPGPMVLFAAPGMLHAGTSLEVFKKWCHDPKNMVIMPGYCVAGTVGAKVLAGEKTIEIDKWTKVTVNLSVKNLSFSAHADAKGIIQLIQMCDPKNIILVHGERKKMISLKQRIHRELGIPTFDPANGSSIVIKTNNPSRIQISSKIVNSAYADARRRLLSERGNFESGINVDAIKPLTKVRFTSGSVALKECKLYIELNAPKSTTATISRVLLKKFRRPYNPHKLVDFESISEIVPNDIPDRVMRLIEKGMLEWLRKDLASLLKQEITQYPTGLASDQATMNPMQLSLKSLKLEYSPENAVLLTWNERDDDVATTFITILNFILQ